MTRKLCAVGSDAEVFLRVAKEEGYAVERWPVKKEKYEKPDSYFSQVIVLLEGLEHGVLVADLSSRRLEPEVSFAIGYLVARMRSTVVGFAGDAKVTGLLADATYVVETLDDLRSTLKAIDPNKKTYVPGSMRSFD